MNQLLGVEQHSIHARCRRLEQGNAVMAALRGGAIGLPLILTLGCAGGPVVDPVGADMSHYEEHLSECEGIARDVEQGKIIGSRMAGYAVAGLLIGAIFGDLDAGRDLGASGAVQGGVEGIGVADVDRKRVVKNCLEQRGYVVLNKEP